MASMVHIPYLVARRSGKMVVQRQENQKILFNNLKGHETTSCEQFPSLSTVLILFRGWEAKPGSSSIVSFFDLFGNNPRKKKKKKTFVTGVKEAL